MMPSPTLARAWVAVWIAGAAAVLLSCGTPHSGGPQALDQVDPSGAQVTFWYTHSGTREAALADLIGLFNATNAHGIQVRGEHIGGHNELYHRMQLGIQGGPLPQIVEAYQNQVQAYRQKGVVVDLAPYIGSAHWGFAPDELADFIPDFAQQDLVDGMQTALLPNRSMEVLYFNRDWLAELGYDEPPADWERFTEICRAAAARPFSGASRGPSRGILWERDASRLASIVFSMGGDVMNSQRTAYTYDTPPVRRALTMMRDLVQTGAAELVSDNRDREAFVEGRALFAQRSSAGAPLIAAAIGDGPGFAWGVSALPKDPGVTTENVYGASLALVKSTPEQQLAAWLFIKWFLEPEQQDRWVSASGYFPVRRSVARRLGPDFRVAYNLLQYGRTEPAVGGYEPVRALVVDAMVEIVDQAGDLDVVLSRLEDDANQTLKPFR